jgi:hypothetical protein
MEKKYFGKPTHLPNKAKIDNATAEVLRQIEGSISEKKKKKKDDDEEMSDEDEDGDKEEEKKGKL